jgi:hypothetical protein
MFEISNRSNSPSVKLVKLTLGVNLFLGVERVVGGGADGVAAAQGEAIS